MSETDDSPSYKVFCPHCEKRQSLLTFKLPLKSVRQCSGCGKSYRINSWMVRQLWSSAFMLWFLLVPILFIPFRVMTHPPGFGQTLAAFFIALPIACLLFGLGGAVAGNYAGRFYIENVLANEESPTDLPSAQYEPIE